LAGTFLFPGFILGAFEKLNYFAYHQVNYKKIRNFHSVRKLILRNYLNNILPEVNHFKTP